MNSQMIRWRKELRPLLLPWLIGVAAGLGALPGLDSGILAVIHYTCMAVIGPLCFGLEFQHKTLPLWLAQPCSRLELWREKQRSVALAVLTLALTGPGAHYLLRQAPLDGWVGILGHPLVLVAGIASAGLWARWLKSFWLSAVLGLATPLVAVTICLRLVIQQDGALAWVVFWENGLTRLAGLIYCLAALWLGRSFWRRLLEPAGWWGRIRLAGPLLALVLLLLGLKEWSIAGTDGSHDGNDLLDMLLLVVGTITTTGYWTLLARSTIGGLAFSITGMFLVFLTAFLANGIRSQFFPQLLPEWTESASAPAVLVAAYCALCYWRGRRRFLSLELNQPLAGGSAELTVWPRAWAWLPGWLRCQPRGPLANLLRKELRLQQPVLLLAAGFSVCWLLALGLAALWRQQDLSPLFVVLSACYAPAALLLAGTISLGEEKGLGLAAWQLTLPSSAWRQWAIKLTMALVVGGAVGVGLPTALLCLTHRVLELDVWNVSEHGWNTMLLLGGCLFVLGFWAAAFTGSTLRAALVAVVSTGGLALCLKCGAWCGQNSGGVIPGLVEFWLPVDEAQKVIALLARHAFQAALVACLAVVLWQSLLGFRRVQTQPAALARHAFILGAAAGAAAFLVSELAAAGPPLLR